MKDLRRGGRNGPWPDSRKQKFFRGEAGPHTNQDVVSATEWFSWPVRLVWTCSLLPVANQPGAPVAMMCWESALKPLVYCSAAGARQ